MNTRDLLWDIVGMGIFESNVMQVLTNQLFIVIRLSLLKCQFISKIYKYRFLILHKYRINIYLCKQLESYFSI